MSDLKTPSRRDTLPRTATSRTSKSDVSRVFPPPPRVPSIRVVKSHNAIKRRPDSPLESSSEDDGEEESATTGVSIRRKKEASAVALFCTGFTDTACQCNNLETLPVRTRQSGESRRCISTERLNELRKRAQEAQKNHRVFTIRGCFYTVRKALLQRGWVEKLDVHRRASMPCNLTIEEMIHQLPVRRAGESRKQYLIKCERNILSRFLEYTPVDFLWTARKEKADWIDMARNPALLINKFHKVPFTTKEGLCSSLRDFHWFYEDGIAETYYPRCFNVWSPDELNDFIDDFRLTGCMGLLKWLAQTYRSHGLAAVGSPTGTVPITSVHFAVKRCREFVDFCQHRDIDCPDENLKIWEHDWDVFLTHHYLVTHENARLLDTEDDPVESYISLVEKLLRDVEIFWPQYHADGFLNIWIVKPGNRCRGRGILLMNNIKKIISLVNPPTITKTRYVVQKYMERPLTIHNTKFDIRQWFLITSVQPLVIWMYKESYLRFSSQEYNLLNYHESVHLTNHAIQKKYVNGQRDERLPQENMWDCHTFQAYLRMIGKLELWSERIYPGMQRAIIGSMLASQDNMDRRPNTFELFGADFMVSEDFYPWLIEINSSPDLGSTTSVTARLCPQCLEDTVKVIIDRRNDPKADTGGFELIYRQSIPPAPAYMGLNLFLKGQQLLTKTSSTRRNQESKLREDLRIIPRPVPRLTHPHPNHTANAGLVTTQGPYIMDLMDCLNLKPNQVSPKTRKTSPLTAVKKANKTSRGTQSSSTRVANSNRKAPVEQKIPKVDSQRRHASCGPRIVVVQEEQPPPETTKGSRKEITCIGNRYCPEKLESTSTPASSRHNQPIQESSIFKSKSASNIFSKLRSTASVNQKMNLSPYRSLTKSSTIGAAGRRDDDHHYCSHFFAVGLSLRAWRAKYNKILNSQKENLPTPLIKSCSPKPHTTKNPSAVVDLKVQEQKS
ncbi:tubulin glycylase 3A-like [Phlebotomus argentipes]|uniref:tubulin glycylase 3A-like n=1 Tax=Phlebotomus argentipes TaxID=94469 RepID=UPI0028935C5C|nr:tubulin glycylase 3A-like [Phlebotomus argentipes]